MINLIFLVSTELIRRVGGFELRTDYCRREELYSGVTAARSWLWFARWRGEMSLGLASDEQVLLHVFVQRSGEDRHLQLLTRWATELPQILFTRIISATEVIPTYFAQERPLGITPSVKLCLFSSSTTRPCLL